MVCYIFPPFFDSSGNIAVPFGSLGAMTLEEGVMSGYGPAVNPAAAFVVKATCLYKSCGLLPHIYSHLAGN